MAKEVIWYDPFGKRNCIDYKYLQALSSVRGTNIRQETLDELATSYILRDSKRKVCLFVFVCVTMIATKRSDIFMFWVQNLGQVCYLGKIAGTVSKWGLF